MVKRFQIETGPHRYSELGADPAQAVVAAFKKHAPKAPGLLTRCRTQGGKWQYISSEAMLRDAGFVIRQTADRTGEPR